jgi:hypothetical protein
MAVAWISGRGSEVTGSFFWLPGGDVAFLGQLLQKSCCAPAAADVLGRRSSPLESVDHLIGLEPHRPRGT